MKRVQEVIKEVEIPILSRVHVEEEESTLDELKSSIIGEFNQVVEVEVVRNSAFSMATFGNILNPNTFKIHSHIQWQWGGHAVPQESSP